jgi:hypothetical protein
MNTLSAYRPRIMLGQLIQTSRCIQGAHTHLIAAMLVLGIHSCSLAEDRIPPLDVRLRPFRL